jgi:hypothetical protein
VVPEPGDPAEDRHRTEVEVAAFARPGLEQRVDLVPSRHDQHFTGPVENLDVKIMPT